MIHSDRERLATSIAVAFGIHLVILTLLYVFGWSIEEFPEYEQPIYVSLDEFELEETPPEPEPSEPAPEELSQADPDPATPEPAPAPEPEPEPAPPAEPEPAPEQPSEPDPAPEPEPSPEPAPEEAPREPLPPPDDIDLLGGDRTAERRRPDRPEYDLDDLAAREEDPPDLPDWATGEQAERDPETRMDDRDAEELARRLDRDPEFERQLRDVLDSVARARRAAPEAGEDAAPETERDPAAEDPGEAESGLIRGISGRGEPNIDLSFTAADFDNNVPPTTTIVVVFDVDPRGFVVPGSLILQQQSRYTRVNEKVREEVRGWRFEPLPSGQTQTQTGIFTLVINRGDVI